MGETNSPPVALKENLYIYKPLSTWDEDYVPSQITMSCD
jgi:hypothetical protein